MAESADKEATVTLPEAIAEAGEFLATHGYASMGPPVRDDHRNQEVVRIFRNGQTIGIGRGGSVAEAVVAAVCEARKALLGTGARWCS